VVKTVQAKISRFPPLTCLRPPSRADDLPSFLEGQEMTCSFFLFLELNVDGTPSGFLLLVPMFTFCFANFLFPPFRGPRDEVLSGYGRVTSPFLPFSTRAVLTRSGLDSNLRRTRFFPFLPFWKAFA